MRGWTWSGLLGAAVIGALGLGCGSGGPDGSNDQGIVFRATGMFRGLESIDEAEIRCTEPTVESAIVDTSYTIDITTIEDFPDRNDAFADPCGGYLALQNNLSTQSINVTEIVLEYEIPGAGIPIDDHSMRTGQTILPPTSDLEAPSGQVNLVYIPMVGQIVPRTMVEFLNQNVNRLPARPFTMNVYIYANSQSDTGIRYASNTVGYTLTIL
ncbi:MAG: hypothetical protein FJ144_02460 [Deltaproteobacteria bacterium]|nr:hypothetical protein [Deltaproteobacteria bacterium]